jgi:hypothetical protein
MVKVEVPTIMMVLVLALFVWAIANGASSCTPSMDARSECAMEVD